MDNELSVFDENINPIFEEIRDLVNNSRNRVYSAVNTEMLNLYWSIGKIIMEIQQGDERATYGDAVVEMTLGDDIKNVYASKYLTYLLTKEELIKIIKDEKELIELAKENEKE